MILLVALLQVLLLLLLFMLLLSILSIDQYTLVILSGRRLAFLLAGAHLATQPLAEMAALDCKRAEPHAPPLPCRLPSCVSVKYSCY